MLGAEESDGEVVEEGAGAGPSMFVADTDARPRKAVPTIEIAFESNDWVEIRLQRIHEAIYLVD